MLRQKTLTLLCSSLLAATLVASTASATPYITMGGQSGVPVTVGNFAGYWGAWQHTVASTDLIYFPLTVQPNNIQPGGGSANTTLSVTAVGRSGNGGPTSLGYIWSNIVATQMNSFGAMAYYSSGNNAQTSNAGLGQTGWQANFPSSTYGSVTLPPGWNPTAYVNQVSVGSAVMNLIIYAP